MEKLSISDLEKMSQSNYVCTSTLSVTDNILGDDKEHKMEFHLFNGFAYCPNYKGKEYYMLYPKKEFIKLAKNMDSTIRERMNLTPTDEITEIHIMATYNKLYAL